MGIRRAHREGVARGRRLYFKISMPLDLANGFTMVIFFFFAVFCETKYYG
jgi:hypothetical protein